MSDETKAIKDNGFSGWQAFCCGTMLMLLIAGLMSIMAGSPTVSIACAAWFYLFDKMYDETKKSQGKR